MSKTSLFIFALLTENWDIFLSGPAVVSTSREIHLMAMFPKKVNSSDAKWIKRTSICTSSLDFAMAGCLTRTIAGDRHTQYVVIPEAKGSAEYQVSLGNLLSNKIYVIVDGIFLKC